MSFAFFLAGSFTLAAFLVLPPLLLLLHALRRYRRESLRSGPISSYVAAAAASGAVLGFNSLTAFISAPAILDGAGRLSWMHGIGLTLSWCCFWAWIGLNVFRRRSRRPHVEA